MAWSAHAHHDGPVRWLRGPPAVAGCRARRTRRPDDHRPRHPGRPAGAGGDGPAGRRRPPRHARAHRARLLQPHAVRGPDRGRPAPRHGPRRGAPRAGAPGRRSAHRRRRASAMRPPSRAPRTASGPSGTTASRTGSSRPSRSRRTTSRASASRDPWTGACPSRSGRHPGPRRVRSRIRECSPTTAGCTVRGPYVCQPVTARRDPCLVHVSSQA